MPASAGTTGFVIPAKAGIQALGSFVSGSKSDCTKLACWLCLSL
jgi:hypothetical protein